MVHVNEKTIKRTLKRALDGTFEIMYDYRCCSKLQENILIQLVVFTAYIQRYAANNRLDIPTVGCIGGINAASCSSENRYECGGIWRVRIPVKMDYGRFIVVLNLSFKNTQPIQYITLESIEGWDFLFCELSTMEVIFVTYEFLSRRTCIAIGNLLPGSRLTNICTIMIERIQRGAFLQEV